MYIDNDKMLSYDSNVNDCKMCKMQTGRNCGLSR